MEGEDKIATLIRGVLAELGEDITRDGLKDTPSRVARSLREMTAGYRTDPAKILGRVFEDSTYDQMVILDGIAFHSMCEHHMLPFMGTVLIGYVPSHGRVVGISKLARLVECYARRLQIQERMTQEIAQAIDTVLKAQGVGVVVSAHHQCMSCRGVKQADSIMITSCLKGVLLENASAKAELLAFASAARKTR